MSDVTVDKITDIISIKIIDFFHNDKDCDAFRKYLLFIKD